jgi:predicted NAD/FAD-binding protein
MSFSLWDVQSGFQYGSRNLQHLFAQRRNILNPRFLKMLLDVRRFWTVAGKDLDGGQLGDETLRSWLLRHRFTGGVVEDYLVPISAAIWSSPSKAMMDFPIITFLNFFKNHGLLRYLEQPRWQTVVGGSFAYVKRFQERFKGTVKVDAAVQSVRRTAEEVYVRTRGGEDLRFDQIVIAVHADEVLPLLSDPSSEERDAFSPWSYQRNHTVLHTDSTVLPPLRSAWASWNYVRERAEDGSEPVSLTYHMNNLQGFTSAQQYCVTLNPRRDIDPSSVVREIQYTHPVYTPAAMRSQAVISGFRGTRRTWYAGSYLGFGFHEDAARSAAEVAKGFGIKF